MFAYSSKDMRGIDPRQCNTYSTWIPSPTQQKKRTSSLEKKEFIKSKVKKLLETRVIREVDYPE